MYTGGLLSLAMNRDFSVLMLVYTGAALLVFVIWHLCVQVMGLYLKTTDTYTNVYWTMRFCHCGCCLWDIVLMYFSILFWSRLVPGSGLDLLTGFVIASLACQYVIVLYCIVEMIVDVQRHFPIHYL